MINLMKPALAAVALAMVATPAWAQEEEEPRTTWRINMVDVKPGGMDRWQEIVMEHIVPAYEAAGLPAPQLHWTMLNDDWDMIILTPVPGGMATFDTHAPAARRALFAALVEQEGSEEAVRAMFDELESLEEKTSSIMTHSHP